MGVNKSVVSTAFVKKSLKLTSKQIEGKRKKKLMVLIGTSVQAANPLASNANMGVNKNVASAAFVKKSLKLKPKQTEG